jgi:MFS family permease
VYYTVTWDWYARLTLSVRDGRIPALAPTKTVGNGPAFLEASSSTKERTMEYKDRSPILLLFGAILLIAGVTMALIGPLEMYCFYLFSEGGRFHYEGFGFGSFMFANIAAQIVGYYLIAVVAVPLGYGHVKRLRWARTISLTLLGFWLVAGIPLMVALLFVLVTSKEPSLLTAIVAIVALALSYAVLPALLIRFYRSRNVRLTFKARDQDPHWIEKVPLPVLVVAAIFVFTIAVLHALILFNGMFPFFHVLFFDLTGITLIALSIIILVGLIWGLVRMKGWAWWGSLLYWVFLSFSSITALSRSTLADILSQMRFAPLEREALGGIPLHGIHLAALAGIPLLVTLGLIAYSRRYFGSHHEPAV